MIFNFDCEKSIYASDELERRVVLQKSLKKKPYKPALFLDRDGVIIKDLHFVSNPKDVYLCKGIKSLLNLAHNQDWDVVVITNQSGISRERLTWMDFDLVNQRMLNLIGSKNLISAIYANGHLESFSEDNWRKPNPGMITCSAKELNIDLNKSILVGDRLTDLVAGARAGIMNLVHVLTGHGKKERVLISQNINKAGKFFQNGKEHNIELIDDLNSFPLIFDNKR